MLDNHAFLKTPGARCAALIAPRSIEYAQSSDKVGRLRARFDRFPFDRQLPRVLRNFSGISLGDPKQYPARGIVARDPYRARDRVGVGDKGEVEGAGIGERHLLRFHEQHLHNRQAAQWQRAAFRHATRTVAFYGRGNRSPL